MGIRQTLNEKPAITTGVTAGIIVIALAFILYQAFGGRPASGGAGTGKQFYSDDDGATWFVDDATKIPPFDHNGKPAYRVQVYQCGDSGKAFVGHLERYSEEDKAKMEEALKQSPQAGPALQYMGFASAMEVKRPNDPQWIKLSQQTAQQFGKIMQPVCPDGSTTNIRPVRPEADNATAK